MADCSGFRGQDVFLPSGVRIYAKIISDDICDGLSAHIPLCYQLDWEGSDLIDRFSPAKNLGVRFRSL